MAPAPEHSPSSQEALLQLEKGSAGPAIQLQQAAQILGIDLALCAGHPELNQDLRSHIASAPKEEWVLRWLLKKLKTKSYRVDPASFLLFQQLIHRIPTKTLAATLNDYKFLTVLNDVLKDLEDDVLGSLQDATASGVERSDSETSHTLGGSPIQEKDINEANRKRKRTESVESNSSTPERRPLLNPFVSAFIYVLDCLYSLMTLVNKRDNVDEIARSHLRQSLRAEPVFVAGMLGRSMKLCASLIIELSRASRVTNLQHLLHVTTAVFDLWDLRSEREDDSDNSSSNSAFAENCFLQALRVQTATRFFGNDSEDAAYVVHTVERLIALHVVLPARAAFFARGGSGIDYSNDEPDWSAVKPVTDTFRPLLKETSEQEKVATVDDTTTTTNPPWRPAELLPAFLDITIRSVPRDNYRRQTTEASWLETFFVATAELAFSAVKEGSPSHDTFKFVPILEEMFRVIRNRKVQLSLNTLLTHAAYTGLLKDELEKVQWSLTAVLIELGVDIFLPNSGFKDSQRLLTALLGKIMLQWTSSHQGSNETYQLIKTGIVIPLLRGFAAARDLPRFIDIWREQLVNVETARVNNSALEKFSIWEDDDLARVYGELMRTSLTDTQVVSQIQTAITEVKSETGNISTTATSYAYFVILEAGSETWRHYGGLGETIDSLKQLIEASKTTLSSRKGPHWRWRLWRLAGNLVEITIKSPDGLLNELGTSLVDQAVKNILHLGKKPKAGSKDYLKSLEACRFVLKITKEFDNTDASEKLNLLTENFVPFLQALVPADGASLEGSWNGRVEAVDSPVALAIAYLVSLLRTPEVWVKIKAENRQAIFGQLLTLATVPQRETVSPLASTANSSNARFLQLWNALVSHEYLLNVPQIGRDLLVVLFERLEKSVVLRSFIVSSLQRFPTRLVNRHHRGVILDMLKEILQSKESSLELSADILSLMAKLAQMPKSSAAITSDWEVLWAISKVISLEGSDIDLRVLQSFRCLVKAVISKFILLSDDERPKVFKKMYHKMSSSISKLKSLDDKALDQFLVRILISQFWEHRAELSSVIDEKDLNSQRQKVFKLVLASLQSEKDLLKQKTPKEKDIIVLTKSLDALEDFEDIAQRSEEADKCLAEIEETIMEGTTRSGRYLQRLIRRRVLAGTKPEEKIALPKSNLAKVFPLQHLYGEEQQLFVREASERFRSMSSDELVRTIHDLREAGLNGANAPYHLLLAGLAVASLSPVEEKESATNQELSALCTDLAEALHSSTSIEQFSLAAECLDIVLRSHPRAVTQWNVDNIMTTVSKCTSPSGPRIPSEYAGTIYIRLCRLTGTLFGLYRQQLGGRFHLIVPALQHLLACLFAPSRKRKRGAQSTAMHERPPWLAPLDASHAVHFTRLLTSLCDPTVSAVSRPTQAGPGPGQEALNDQTKKAKRVAGQHLQYLVMEYTQCSLRSPVSPEMKAALMPGLYAVLDVMSRDTKRALNAGLDVSGRAIFKTLYDDYVKFGKWNNKG
ncbi:hypothetical protein VTN77DRAFT_8857 [Rasamsonia byssochlamydoides]|uniref:uncharacterized protein n=1 Tax=Rasamsonia byssochlamydoides TaxID=89139 RepID=UPI003742E9B8